jgi:hypothetical protein
MKKRRKYFKAIIYTSIMKKITISVMILLISGLGMMAHSQELPETEYKGVINLLPVYLFVNGLRVDYDFSINRNHWIQAGPTIYLSENKSERYLAGDEYLRHTGIGFNLNHRYYPGGGFRANNVYISYGGSMHYNHLEYDEEVGSLNSKRYSAIQKFGADVVMGFYSVTAERLLLDIYAGMGIRYSILSSDANTPHEFNEGYYSPGFSGNILVMGIRIGFLTFPSKN